MMTCTNSLLGVHGVQEHNFQQLQHAKAPVQPAQQSAAANNHAFPSALPSPAGRSSIGKHSRLRLRRPPTQSTMSPIPVQMDKKHVQQRREALDHTSGKAFGPNREGKDAEVQPTATLENGTVDLLPPAPLQTAAALRVHRHWASATSKAAESDEPVLDCCEASADCNGSLDVQLPAAAIASVQSQSLIGRKVASAMSADLRSTGMQTQEASYHYPV